MRRLPIFRLCLPTQPPPLIGVRLLTCLLAGLQLALAADLSARPFRSIIDLRLVSTFGLCLPNSLRLASPAVLPAAFQLIPGLRPRPVFRPKPPAALRLAPSTNLLVSPSNLTSDSRRPLIPSALPSGLPLALAADLPFGPALRTTRPTPAVASPALLREQSPTCVFDLPLSVAFELDLRFLVCSIPSALPSG